MPSSQSESDYIRTTTQNFISRSANLLGASNVRIKGKSIVQPNVTIHGDYGASVHIGRYCYIDEGVVIAPTVVPISSDPMLPGDDIGSGSSSTQADDGQSSSPSSPTTTPPSSNQKAIHLQIGSYTHIGSNTQVQSLSIGSSVHIGSNCIISPRSKIYDCCIIEDNTVIPPDMIVPPFSRVRGSPGRIVGSLPECCGGELLEGCVDDFAVFVRRVLGKDAGNGD